MGLCDEFGWDGGEAVRGIEGLGSKSIEGFGVEGGVSEV